MRPSLAVVLAVVLAAGQGGTAARATPTEDRPRANLLDVPFVAQREGQCGGAAAAMVLRYWGEPHVHAEDFGALLDSDARGIRVDDLCAAIEERGWRVHVFRGDERDVDRHLALGRPVIALIEPSKGRRHYVVLVGNAPELVIVHDPAVGPHRVHARDDLAVSWDRTGNLAILVLPDPSRGDDETEETARAAGEPVAASTAALEVASVAFREERWNAAADAAARAVELDPANEHAWRILATSRFLAGDRFGAVEAWNRVGAPRVDLVSTSGLDAIDAQTVIERLGIRPGEVLTPAKLAHAERRLDALPALGRSAVRLRPLGGDWASVDAVGVARSRWNRGAFELVRGAVDATVESEITIDAASPTGGGELLSLRGRWHEHRPRVSLSLATPGVARLPGILRVDALWERETHAIAAEEADVAGERVVETRRRGAATLGDWIGAQTHAQAVVAVERWNARGFDVSIGAALERRFARDRGAARLAVDRFLPLEGSDAFQTARLFAAWRSTLAATRPRWSARVGVSVASAHAPRLLWPGAGVGIAREPLLRGHALLEDGVVTGEAFGRVLVHGNVEGTAYPLALGPLRLGGAAFLDWARVAERGSGRGTLPLQMDPGLGLRARLPGVGGHFRVDAAFANFRTDATLSMAWVINEGG